MWKKQTISRKSVSLLVLTMLMALTLITFLPAVNATLLISRESYAFVTVSPNPIGVGQTVLITFGITEPLPSAAFGWEDLEVTVTDPHDITTSLGKFKSESTGSTWTTYIPDEVGTWYFQCSFTGMWLNFTGQEPTTRRWGTWERYYKPDTSEEVALTVQEEQIEWLPPAEPPTDYWERPIYGENREWHPIGGPMLLTSAGFARGNVVPNTTGPDSPHIMWTREIDFGGIVGGEDMHGYYTGLSYERKWYGIIMQGRLYFNLYPAGFGGSYLPGFACVDLRTGEELWRNEEGRISMGQILRMETPNQHGCIPYLWETGFFSYKMYNAFSGEWILDIENIPGGTMVTGPDGEILLYRLYTDPATGVRKLSLWNSTHVDGQFAAFEGFYWSWRPPQGGKLNGTTGIMWTKDVASVPGNPGVAAIDDGVIYCRTLLTEPEVAVHCAYDAETGALLWQENRTGLLARVNFVNVGSMGDGVWTEYTKEDRRWYGFDVKTGKQIWKTEPLDAWAMFHACSAIADGKFYTASYDGYIHCFDVTDGTELWSYYSGSSGFETPYGHFPFMVFHDSFTIADGKVYAATGEHSPNDPLYRGYKLHCIDAETGKGIWNISCWATPPAVAEGYAVALNHYDNRIYCYGKGKTATTVSVSQQTIANGSKLLITGTVTDQSPAQPGTPCVSKESMEEWMGYLHMQKPQPTVTTGVPVLLLAMRSDGSIIEIGTAISYTAGFAYEWTPPDEDIYTITATFYGDESYGSSWDATHALVTAAPPELEEEAEAPAYTAIELGIIAAVVVAIVIGIVNLYALRKRK